MEKKYETLGGMFKVRISTDNDENNLSDEELDILKEEYEDLKGELDCLKKKIDANSPKEQKAKKKKKILDDDDIPYEVRMKHIIQAYRKDQEKWGKLIDYAKHLEAEVIRYKEIMIANGFTEKIEGIDVEDTAQLIKELRKKIRDLEARVKELNKYEGDPGRRIRDLENKIENTYPQRKHRVATYKKIIKSQELYIEELQKILDQNGIPYHPKQPINDIEAKGADNIDEYAVR